MHFFRSTLALAPALAISVSASAGAASFGPPRPRSVLRANNASAAARLPNAVRSRISAAATATYALKDVGAPPASGYRVFFAPVGFNKTGQIVGQAYTATDPGSNYQQCIAYTGSDWIDLSASRSLTCYATSGVSDADSSGAFGAVGEVDVPTNSQLVPFYAHASSKSATMTTFSSNSPAELYTMNASGLAAGYTYDTPVAGFSYDEPVATSTGSSIGLLQATCVTAVAGCLAYTYALTLPAGNSRSITAGGTVLAYASNATTGQFVEYTGGTKPKFVQFSLPLDNGNGAGDIVGMDDRGDVVYQEYDPKSQKTLGWTYSPSANTARNFGTLPGNSCTDYVPLYVNGPGRTLGYTTSCSFASDETYWTWDAANGMVALTFNHTSYYSATPKLINDLGQVATDLETTAGVHHWGILTPPSKL